MLGDMKAQVWSDTILIERCQKGDARAIDELLDKYSRAAFAYAFKLTRHVEEAADLVSEGFLRIFNGIGGYQARSSFAAWMYTILRNCFYDICKKNRKFRLVTSLDATPDSEEGRGLIHLIDGADSPYEVASKADVLRSIKAFVRTLPEDQSRLILMYHEEGLSYKEIEDILQIPEGTIKSRLHRGRLYLRRCAESQTGLIDSLAGC